MTDTDATAGDGPEPDAADAANQPPPGEEPSPADAPDTVATPAPAPATVGASTYDLLRDRLRAVAARLLDAANQLNAQRAEVFASVPLALAEQDRLTTQQPSNPRDALCFNDLLLFGYNVVGALGRARNVDDAFELFRVSQAAANDWTFSPLAKDDPDWFLSDAGFQRDISELFTYYADTRLMGLQLKGDRLLMILSVGSSDDDVRVLRWQLEGDHVRYIDAYGDHELTTTERYDFTWSDAGRDKIVEGRWRHYNIADTLFIGLDRGRLDLRIDDAVVGGRSILTEAVAEKDQSLDEVRVGYATLGDIVLVRLTPYRENDERYFIYNRLTRTAQRADAIGRNCHQLPEDQGIVFPGGYHLQNGETKVFATNATGFGFHAAHLSPNGEDILYVYQRPTTGEYLLCTYNVVARSMDPPIQCFGYALFDDGVIVCVRSAAEPQRVHTISVYTSPYCSIENYVPSVGSDSFMGRIGNPELVRVLGEAISVARDSSDPEFNAAVFEALVGRSTVLLDTHAWLNAPEANGLGGLLAELRKTAGGVLDEFAAVVAAKKEAADQLANADRVVADLTADSELEIRDAAAYIDRLAAARSVLGTLSQLADVRQMDMTALGALRNRVQDVHERLATRAIEFLDHDEALHSLIEELDGAERAGVTTPTSAAVRALAAGVDQAGDRLVLLTEVVGGLDVDDTTRKTAVLSRLSDALARRNAVRAGLDQVANGLRTTEAAAGFQAAMAVLAQRAQAALMTTVDAPSCDAALATLSAELENIDLAYG
ncbi:MAG TPA: DNA repair ATPase, partial [Ilumatobacteraceae bacterium]